MHHSHGIVLQNFNTKDNCASVITNQMLWNSKDTTPISYYCICVGLNKHNCFSAQLCLFNPTLTERPYQKAGKSIIKTS